MDIGSFKDFVNEGDIVADFAKKLEKELGSDYGYEVKNNKLRITYKDKVVGVVQWSDIKKGLDVSKVISSIEDRMDTKKKEKGKGLSFGKFDIDTRGD
jgi:hypothetical protein